MINCKKSIKCLFVGDVALGDHPKSVGFGFYSKYKQGIPINKADTLFPKGIKGDIVFGNLEFNIGEFSLSGTHFNYLNCRGISQYADFLKIAGFNILNIANNHIFQHGIEEFDKTVSLLLSKGIMVAGLKNNLDTCDLMKVDGSSVAFLAWSMRPRQGFDCEPPYKEFNEDDCCREIENTKSRADMICVSLHWGDEFIEIPSDEERRIARMLINRGVNIVVGHHPHVIREVEEYNGGLIAYSLGNFICDMTWNSLTSKTGLLYVEFADGRILDWKWFQGKIGKDYFPRYNKSKLMASVDCKSINFSKLNSKLSHSTYNELAEKALSMHRKRTLLHMIRNVYKYDPKILYGIIRNAITLRFSKKDCKVRN